jgi:hypothetical protein
VADTEVIVFGAEICAESLATMRARGGSWAAYVNMALDSAARGHLQFLRVGEGCTFAAPPEQLPDTRESINWAYRFCGMVNLQTGAIDRAEKETA